MTNALFAILVSVIFSSAFVSAQSLKIDNFTIKTNGGTDLISVKTDGKVSVNGEQIGVLQKDGKLKNKQGETIAEIDKSGKITAKQKPLGIVNKFGEYDNGSWQTIGWTQGGSFTLADKNSLTISPNDKKYHQTASFLNVVYFFISEVKTDPLTVSIDDEKLAGKFKYQDGHLVASISRSSGNGGISDRSYSTKIFGDGRIVHAGETVYAIRTPSDKKDRQKKINRFLQKAEEMNFLAIYEKYSAIPTRFMHDGATVSTGVMVNGIFRELVCNAGSTCNQEIVELHKYFVALFAEEMSKRD